MATPPIIWRPPQRFVSGDSLIFQQNLPDYPPSAGFAIQLTVSQVLPNGAKILTQVVSTPDATNSYHTFNVLNFCAGADAGTYILSEEVFNAGTGEKHQIYFDDAFKLGPDLNDVLASLPVETEAQINLRLLNVTYRNLIQLKFAETEDLRSRFKVQDEQKVLEDIKYWKAVRVNEIQLERARNGQRPGNVTEAFFAIG